MRAPAGFHPGDRVHVVTGPDKGNYGVVESVSVSVMDSGRRVVHVTMTSGPDYDQVIALLPGQLELVPQSWPCTVYLTLRGGPSITPLHFTAAETTAPIERALRWLDGLPWRERVTYIRVTHPRGDAEASVVPGPRWVVDRDHLRLRHPGITLANAMYPDGRPGRDLAHAHDMQHADYPQDHAHLEGEL